MNCFQSEAAGQQHNGLTPHASLCAECMHWPKAAKLAVCIMPKRGYRLPPKATVGLDRKFAVWLVDSAARHNAKLIEKQGKVKLAGHRLWRRRMWMRKFCVQRRSSRMGQGCASSTPSAEVLWAEPPVVLCLGGDWWSHMPSLLGSLLVDALTGSESGNRPRAVTLHRGLCIRNSRRL